MVGHWETGYFTFEVRIRIACRTWGSGCKHSRLPGTAGTPPIRPVHGIAEFQKKYESMNGLDTFTDVNLYFTVP